MCFFSCLIKLGREKLKVQENIIRDRFTCKFGSGQVCPILCTEIVLEFSVLLPIGTAEWTIWRNFFKKGIDFDPKLPILLFFFYPKWIWETILSSFNAKPLERYFKRPASVSCGEIGTQCFCGEIGTWAGIGLKNVKAGLALLVPFDLASYYSGLWCPCAMNLKWVPFKNKINLGPVSNTFVMKQTFYLQKVEAPKVTLDILFGILSEHSVQVSEKIKVVFGKYIFCVQL